MGYVPIKGGVKAIEAAEELVRFFRLQGESAPLEVQQIEKSMRLAVDRVMGEGSLYAPFHAAVALKQAEGDTVEASFILRAYRSTLPRIGYSQTADTVEMRIIRRISAAFKDIPGGQVLGPTRDYSLRLLNLELAEEGAAQINAFLDRYIKKIKGEKDSLPRATASFPKVVEMLRREGLIEEQSQEQHQKGDSDVVPDITRQPLIFPADRAARLQALARGETGGLMALAYSSMRGYGNVHPTLGELRVGYLPVYLDDEAAGVKRAIIGEVLVTEAEIIACMENSAEQDVLPRFSLGYGLCFGHNEIKAISMAILDRTMRNKGGKAPVEDEEFVLYHTDGIEAAGFTSHWKLPHYVTFQSVLDRMRRMQKDFTGSKAAGREMELNNE